MSDKYPSRPRGKQGGTCGAYRRNFPQSVRWAVDQDYVHDLSPSERAWLAQFNDAHYGADFRGTSPEDWPLEARRERYNAKNAANTDVFAPLAEDARLEPMDECLDLEAGEQDAGPAPEYLSSPEYQALLAEYRRHLKPGRKPSAPQETPAYQAAREALVSYLQRAANKGEP